jgi:cysteine desulfurase / selenocysteine lyase
VQRLGLPTIARYEHDLLDYATATLQIVLGLRLIGTASDKASVLPFVLAGHHQSRQIDATRWCRQAV